MADVELIIKIPGELYKDIKEHGLCGYSSDREIVSGAIANGRLLPKGHGRLVDADEAIKTLKSLGSRDYRREKGTIQEAIKMLNYEEYTPTIIPADKDGEE